MAKIYETPEDVARDVLKEQSAKARLDATQQEASGLSLVGMSLVAQIFHERKPETRGWLAIASVISGVVGMIEIARSWITHGKASGLKMERERLGPQVVSYPSPNAAAPAAMPEAETEIDPSCGCRIAKNTKKIEAKSLIEHAETSDVTRTL